MSKDSMVLQVLEKVPNLKFEVAIGVNGAFWVKAMDPRTTVALSNAILNSEMIKNYSDMSAMVQGVLQAAKKGVRD